MSNATPFQIKDTQVRVLTDETGETWFVGRYVCERLVDHLAVRLKTA